MNQLDIPVTAGKPARPTEKDPRVAQALVPLMLPRVTEWCLSSGDESAKDPANQAEIGEQLEEAFGATDCDGYALAKYLNDRFYWDPDVDLVDILDSAGHRQGEVLRQLTDAWIRETGLQPKHTVGDQVKIQYASRGMGSAGRKPAEYVGTIWQVYRDVGKYTVNVPGLGHAKPGAQGVQGLLLTWEEVDGWNGSIAAA